MRKGRVIPAAFLAAVLSGISADPAQAESLSSPGYALENGDTNGDGDRDLSDAVQLLGHLFSGAPGPVPLAFCGADVPAVENGDTNGDGSIDLSDPVRLLGWLFTGSLVPVSACSEGGGGAGNPNPRVVPPHARPHGRAYGDWGAAWWQWAMGIAAPVNPVTDATGEHCDEGQSGSVWFLAGTFGDSAERSCTVPAGKTLVIPMINQVTWTPEDYDFALSLGITGSSVEYVLRKLAAIFEDHVTALTCKVDGVELKDLFSYRVMSTSTFPLMLGPDNVLGGFGYADGLREVAVSDGYYIILAPLPPGEHEVVFGGALSCTAAECSGIDFAFTVEVTYHLTVN